jgi:DNA-binding transcriptional LysR family regulator
VVPVRNSGQSAALDGGNADLEIGSRRAPADAGVHTTLITLETLRLAVPRDHRLAAQPRVGLADAATGRRAGPVA